MLPNNKSFWCLPLHGFGRERGHESVQWTRDSFSTAGSACGTVTSSATTQQAPAVGEQQTGGTPRLADFGDRLPSYYSSIPLSWDAPESFSYLVLNDIRGSREPEALHVGRKVLQAVWCWPSALPKASVGKELFGFAELTVSASSEHPLLSSPKPLTNDVASN